MIENNYFKDKFLSKSFQESVWNLIGTILFIYLTGFGILLTDYLATKIPNWSILVYTTVVSVIPVVKAWISRNANIQLDDMRSEYLSSQKTWLDDRDKLKDELNAEKVKTAMLNYDLEQTKKQLPKPV